MIEINVMYGSPVDAEWQKKAFKDETSCIEWCRKHSEKIGRINDYWTGFQPISHFEIMDAIRESIISQYVRHHKKLNHRKRCV